MEFKIFEWTHTFLNANIFHLINLYPCVSAKKIILSTDVYEKFRHIDYIKTIFTIPIWTNTRTQYNFDCLSLPFTHIHKAHDHKKKNNKFFAQSWKSETLRNDFPSKKKKKIFVAACSVFLVVGFSCFLHVETKFTLELFVCEKKK